MKRILSAAAVLSVLAAVGCSNAMIQPQAASDAASDAAKAAAPAAETHTDAAAAETAADAKADAKSDAAADAKTDSSADAKSAEASETAAKTLAPKAVIAPWAAGDFVVYRFSGSFHKTAATLTEKVVARKGDTFTLDVTYDDGTTKETIRAHMKGDSPARADVVSVARLSHGKEKAASKALFDEIFARVALSADQNEAQLGSETVKVNVAGSGALACERATYRVKLGKESATMRTVASAGFVWGDVGADITTADGKVLYKAEVVDTGHASTKAPAVASADDDY